MFLTSSLSILGLAFSFSFLSVLGGLMESSRYLARISSSRLLYYRFRMSLISISFFRSSSASFLSSSSIFSRRKDSGMNSGGE